jgi:hypothetical protein
MAKEHLNRYLAAFDFRRNNRAMLGINDTQRKANVLNDIEGKRLTYRWPAEAQEASI